MSDTRLPLNNTRKKDTDIKAEKLLLKQPEHFEKKAFGTPFDPHSDVASTVISSLLNIEDNWCLTRTSQNLNRLFSKPFDKILLTLKSIHQQLLEHVIHGSFSEAKVIIEQYPILLLYKGTVTDYSGRKITGTAYQMALGAEDIEMAEMIQSHLKQLPEGLIEIVRQEEQQFLHDEKDQKKEEDSKKIKALEVITQFILDAKVDEVTADSQLNLKINERLQIALTQFRKTLEPKEIITTGKHFHAPLLQKAFELYNHNYGAFGDHWDCPKNMLFWRQVIGYIQRFLPACYAQAFCQGIYYIVEDGEKLRRSLKFRFNTDVSFFPLDLDPHFRLGFEYGGAVAEPAGSSQGLWAWGVGRGADFRNLCQAKTARLQILCNTRPVNRSVAAV